MADGEWDASQEAFDVKRGKLPVVKSGCHGGARFYCVINPAAGSARLSRNRFLMRRRQFVYTGFRYHECNADFKSPRLPGQEENARRLRRTRHGSMETASQAADPCTARYIQVP